MYSSVGHAWSLCGILIVYEQVNGRYKKWRIVRILLSKSIAH